MQKEKPLFGNWEEWSSIQGQIPINYNKCLEDYSNIG
jgi:hypothetical protein